MSRLSREKKREEQRAVPTAAPVVAPLDVRVPGDGPGAGGASIGGVPVAPAPGQEIQHAVLAHLHRIALASGHPVLAHVHDERIGYVVPLRMDPDGSTHFTAEPARMRPAEEHGVPGEQGDVGLGGGEAPTELLPTVAGAQPDAAEAQPPAGFGNTAPPAPPMPAPSTPPAPAEPRDLPTHLLRATPEPVRDATPTFPLRSLADTEKGVRPDPTTFPLRAVPESAERTDGPGTPTAPGTVSAPTGTFGPPPAMDVQPEPAPEPEPAPSADVPPRPEPAAFVDVTPPTGPAAFVDVTPQPEPAQFLDVTPQPAPTPAPERKPAPAPLIDVTAEPEPDPKPTPARGFDAVAEAVLGDDPRTAPGDGSTPALLAEPVARINEAVKAGRTDTAAQLAEHTVAEASVSLGPEHPEVLRLRELTAYIAYLAGDALRSFHLSLDLARIHRHARDTEAAYGNIQSAASAWRAVRNPVQGLSLGYDLIGLWTELVAEGGPAADDLGQLESARTRMGRLEVRARDAGVR
ncbi:tetratricopeptide repeat protein [Streptomyces sp. NPDC048751]|uniref:tetratricopeptide repeat protein n=1 Tax=Streptomyces sp. NPDC048751 TaxID=3365591 RepID=UPI00371C8CAC